MSFWEVFKNEAKSIFSDMAIVLTIFGGVILYSLLYPQPYVNQSISNLSICVVDNDKSDVSRDLIFKLNSTPQAIITRIENSETDAKEALIAGDVKAILIIPKDFKRDISLNKSPTIALGADASYFLIYSGILEASMKSILTQNATIKITNLLKNEIPLAKAKESYVPYNLNIINLFNRQNSYTQYVIPAVFMLILQQTLIIGLGILGGGINEKIKNKEKCYALEAPVWMMMFSRIIIFGLIYAFHMLFYFGFSFETFHVTRLSNIINLLTFGFPFLLSSIFLGIFLGSLFSSREIATPVILLTSLPLVFTAGFIWPIEAIPNVLVFISNLFPSTPTMQGFLALNQMGADFASVINQYTILWVQVIIYAILGYFAINKRRKI